MHAVIPHLLRDGCDNGEGHCLENGGEGQLKTTHHILRLPQEKQQTQASSHQTYQSHKTQDSPRGLYHVGFPVFHEHNKH